eukprot:TRINITY_DN9860_c0_g1_i1.p1 TRINITY_DN9860_c0_g1~~TRINITY_DN9860_c0_g1_i1.p1  ORF type:complete len:102 (-),score=21.83 TRINITY_DN9860_c0_g1_i1:10-315(-)
MLKLGIIGHATNSLPFRDGYFFYRMNLSEQPPSMQLTPLKEETHHDQQEFQDSYSDIESGPTGPQLPKHISERLRAELREEGEFKSVSEYGGGGGDRDSEQ